MQGPPIGGGTKEPAFIGGAHHWSLRALASIGAARAVATCAVKQGIVGFGGKKFMLGEGCI